MVEVKFWQGGGLPAEGKWWENTIGSLAINLRQELWSEVVSGEGSQRRARVAGTARARDNVCAGEVDAAREVRCLTRASTRHRRKLAAAV